MNKDYAEPWPPKHPLDLGAPPNGPTPLWMKSNPPVLQCFITYEGGPTPLFNIPRTSTSWKTLHRSGLTESPGALFIRANPARQRADEGLFLLASLPNVKADGLGKKLFRARTHQAFHRFLETLFTQSYMGLSKGPDVCTKSGELLP